MRFVFLIRLKRLSLFVKIKNGEKIKLNFGDYIIFFYKCLGEWFSLNQIIW